MDAPTATKEVNKKVDELLDKVDEVIDAQKELAEKQEAILDQVAVEEKEDETMEKEVEKVSSIQSSFIVRTKSHRFLFPLIVTAGVVLVWRGLSGIFDATPLVNYSIISLVLGIAILWFFNNMKSL
jgi:hypothetical protein